MGAAATMSPFPATHVMHNNNICNYTSYSLKNKKIILVVNCLANMLSPQLVSPSATSSSSSSSVRSNNQHHHHHQYNYNNVQIHEMSIPNDLIGCIIGRGGHKISEIRYEIGRVFYLIIYHAILDKQVVRI